MDLWISLLSFSGCEITWFVFGRWWLQLWTVMKPQDCGAPRSLLTASWLRDTPYFVSEISTTEQPPTPSRGLDSTCGVTLVSISQLSSGSSVVTQCGGWDGGRPGCRLARSENSQRRESYCKQNNRSTDQKQQQHQLSLSLCLLWTQYNIGYFGYNKESLLKYWNMRVYYTHCIFY